MEKYSGLSIPDLKYVTGIVIIASVTI